MPHRSTLAEIPERYAIWDQLIYLLRAFPRWLFLGTLIFAPWAYGGTTAKTVGVLNLLLATVIGTWILELAIRRRVPRVPAPLLISAGIILVLGWLMALNASAIYDTEYKAFFPIRKLLSFAPSSVDEAISISWMVRTTVLLGSILFIADLSLRPQWVSRVWVTIGFAGGSIALFGLVQRATGAVLPFWEYRPWEFSTFFAAYYYHANAGAFLNLVLPLTAGLALRAFSKPNQALQRAAWFTATLLILVAVVVNTSRVAQFLSLLALLALAFGPAQRALSHALKRNRIGFVVTIVLALLVLFASGQANIAGTPVQRWRSALEQLPKDSRWQAYKLATQVLPDAGWFGFGPGTFRAIFPSYEQGKSVKEPGRWRHLHQDYLQTGIEWGLAGSVCWAALFFGGIATGITALVQLRKALPLRPRLQRILPFVLIALGTVALHSLYDFPMQIASLQLYAATYLGICWGSRWLFKETPATQSKP